MSNNSNSQNNNQDKWANNKPKNNKENKRLAKQIGMALAGLTLGATFIAAVVMGAKQGGYESQIVMQDETIVEQKTTMETQKASLVEQKIALEAQKTAMAELDAKIVEYEATIAAHEADIVRHKATIVRNQESNLETAMALNLAETALAEAKETETSAFVDSVTLTAERDRLIVEKARLEAEKTDALATKEALIVAHQAAIAEYEATIAQLEANAKQSGIIYTIDELNLFYNTEEGIETVQLQSDSGGFVESANEATAEIEIPTYHFELETRIVPVYKTADEVAINGDKSVAPGELVIKREGARIRVDTDGNFEETSPFPKVLGWWEIGYYEQDTSYVLNPSEANQLLVKIEFATPAKAQIVYFTISVKNSGVVYYHSELNGYDGDLTLPAIYKFVLGESWKVIEITPRVIGEAEVKTYQFSWYGENYQVVISVENGLLIEGFVNHLLTDGTVEKLSAGQGNITPPPFDSNYQWANYEPLLLNWLNGFDNSENAETSLVIGEPIIKSGSYENKEIAETVELSVHIDLPSTPIIDQGGLSPIVELTPPVDVALPKAESTDFSANQKAWNDWWTAFSIAAGELDLRFGEKQNGLSDNPSWIWLPTAAFLQNADGSNVKSDLADVMSWQFDSEHRLIGISIGRKGTVIPIILSTPILPSDLPSVELISEWGTDILTFILDEVLILDFKNINLLSAWSIIGRTTEISEKYGAKLSAYPVFRELLNVLSWQYWDLYRDQITALVTSIEIDSMVDSWITNLVGPRATAEGEIQKTDPMVVNLENKPVQEMVRLKTLAIYNRVAKSFGWTKKTRVLFFEYNEDNNNGILWFEKVGTYTDLGDTFEYQRVSIAVFDWGRADNGKVEILDGYQIRVYESNELINDQNGPWRILDDSSKTSETVVSMRTPVYVAPKGIDAEARIIQHGMIRGINAVITPLASAIPATGTAHGVLFDGLVASIKEQTGAKNMRWSWNEVDNTFEIVKGKGKRAKTYTLRNVRYDPTQNDLFGVNLLDIIKELK